MPSTKSKQTVTQNSQSSRVHICSEPQLLAFAQELAEEIQRQPLDQGLPRLVLLGPMGAGKSTLARALLEALGIDRAAEGSSCGTRIAAQTEEK